MKHHVLYGLIVAAAIVTVPVSLATGQEPSAAQRLQELAANPPAPEVPKETLDKFKSNYESANYPKILVVVTSDTARFPAGSVDVLRAEVTRWLTRVPEVQVLSQLDAQVEKQIAAASTPAERSARVQAVSKAEVLLLVNMHVAAGSNPQPDLQGTAECHDIIGKRVLASYSFSWDSTEPVNRGRYLAASIARHVMEDFAPQEAKWFTVVFNDLADAKELRRITDELNTAKVTIGRAKTEWVDDPQAGGSQGRAEVQYKGDAAGLVGDLESVLERLDLPAQKVMMSGQDIIVTAGGLSRARAKELADAYAALGSPPVIFLAKGESAGNASGSSSSGSAGSGRTEPGKPESGRINSARRGKKDLAGSDAAKSDSAKRDSVGTGTPGIFSETLKSLFIKAGIHPDVRTLPEGEMNNVIQALQDNNEGTAVELLKNKVASEGLIVSTTTEQKRVAVWIVDLERKKQVAVALKDWRGGADQESMERMAARCAHELIPQLARYATADEPVNYLAEIPGFQDEIQVSDAVAVLESGLRPKLQGSIKYNISSKEGLTLASLSFRYKDSRPGEVATSIVRAFRERMNLPALTYRAVPGELVLKVGAGLERPLWHMLTVAKAADDNEHEQFLNQLQSVLKEMGSPRVGVLMTTPDGKTDSTTLATGWTDRLQEVLAEAKVQVVDARELRAKIDAMVQQHQQFRQEGQVAEAMRQLPLCDLVVLGQIEQTPEKERVFFRLVDRRNGMFFGSAMWPAASSAGNKKYPATDELKAQYIAGSLLAGLLRQSGQPSTMEVVVKDARNFEEMMAVASAISNNIPNVSGTEQMTFAYGVGRFLVRYKGSFDSMIKRMQADQTRFPFKIVTDRLDRGCLELQIKSDRPAEWNNNIAKTRTEPVQAGSQESSGSAGPAPQQSRNNWAIIVGVGAYENITPLHFSPADAKLVYATLKSYCGYMDDRIILLTDGFNDAKGRPTRENILKAITLLAREAAEGDTILVYFTGHGTQIGKEGCLIPIDFKVPEKTSSSTAQQLAQQAMSACVSISDVRRILGESKATKRIMILDSCHSGSSLGLEAAAVDESIGNSAEGAGAVTLASCGPKETSLELADLGQSLFTYWLAKGLGGLADRDSQGNKNNTVESDELYKYVFAKVSEDAAKRDSQQHPRYMGVIDGTIVLARFQAP